MRAENSQQIYQQHNSIYSIQNYLHAGRAKIVVNKKGDVTYTNDISIKQFKLKAGENLSKLNSDTDLLSLINNLSAIKYDNFNFDLFVFDDQNSANYEVEIERIEVAGEESFVLFFHSSENTTVVENKINNLHHALEYGEVPVIIVDDLGKVIYATKSFEKLLELDLDVIYNNHIVSVLSWHLSKDEITNIQSALIKGKSWSTTINIISKNIDKTNLELKLNPIIVNDSGKKNFILTGHDVSIYYQRNKVIQQSEEKLKSIINNISDPLLILKNVKDDLVFEYANEMFYDVFEVDKSRLKQLRTEKILDVILYEKIKTSIYLLERNNLNYVDFDYSDSNLKNYVVKINQSIDISDSTNIFIVNIRDITDRINNEKQIKQAYKKEQQLNQLKTTFLHNMSHELRTPATAVKGYSEIIKDCLETKDYEAISEITILMDNVISRIINLFTKIIEVSEIESDRLEMNKVKLNCNKILKAVFENIKIDARDKNIDLQFNPGDFYDLIEIDWCKLQKVIEYLLENSIKYTEVGYIKLQSRKVGSEIIITIEDTGCGIEDKILENLLLPFIQAEDDGYTREFEGAGLGLTIAYQYTRLMGGEIKITSKKNIGTKIDVKFPIVIPF